MKFTLTIAAMVLAMTATANAANSGDSTVWQGDSFVTTATPQCTSGGILVGNSYRAIFAPKSLPGNSASDQLALFFPHSTIQIVPKSGTLHGSKSVTINAILSNALLYSESPTGHSYVVSPTTIKTTTPSVTITATISRFWLNGCSVTLSGNLSRRPGNIQF